MVEPYLARPERTLARLGSARFGRQTVAAVKSSKSGVRDADMKNAAEKESIRRQWVYVAVSPFFAAATALTRPISREMYCDISCLTQRRDMPCVSFNGTSFRRYNG